jgi:hypothetical protein
VTGGARAATRRTLTGLRAPLLRPPRARARLARRSGSACAGARRRLAPQSPLPRRRTHACSVHVGDRPPKQDSHEAIPIVNANMCTADMRSCLLDPRHPALGAKEGDVLRAESMCLW